MEKLAFAFTKNSSILHIDYLLIFLSSVGANSLWHQNAVQRGWYTLVELKYQTKA